MSTQEVDTITAGSSRVTATPQAMALHKNFINAMSGLKREMVRSIFYLRAIADRKVYRMLGYSHIGEYAEKEAGLSAGQCRAFLNIGKKLQDLPQMRQALEDGGISWRKANIIIGKADPESEASLVDAARRLGEEALRESVRTPKSRRKKSSGQPTRRKGKASGGRGGFPAHSGSQHAGLELPDTLAGDSAGAPAQNEDTFPNATDNLGGNEVNTEAVQHVLFKFTPEQYAIWLTLTAKARGPNKEARLLAALQRPNGGGTEGYLLIVQECPKCGMAWFQTPRGPFQASRALLETARCDATIENEDAERRRVVPPRLRRKVLRRDNYQCQTMGCGHTQHLELHHRVPLAQGGKTLEENLVTSAAGAIEICTSKKTLSRF